MWFLRPSVLTLAMDIIRNPSYCRAIDPDMALNNSSSLDVTVALVTAQASQISMVLVVA